MEGFWMYSSGLSSFSFGKLTYCWLHNKRLCRKKNSRIKGSYFSGTQMNSMCTIQFYTCLISNFKNNRFGFDITTMQTEFRCVHLRWTSPTMVFTMQKYQNIRWCSYIIVDKSFTPAIQIYIVLYSVQIITKWKW